MAFHADTGGTQDPPWGGIAEMLEDVADAIQYGTPTAGHLAASRDDRTLDWILPSRQTHRGRR
jgi:hypothetical protein